MDTRTRILKTPSTHAWCAVAFPHRTGRVGPLAFWTEVARSRLEVTIPAPCWALGTRRSTLHRAILAGSASEAHGLIGLADRRLIAAHLAQSTRIFGTRPPRLTPRAHGTYPAAALQRGALGIVPCAGCTIDAIGGGGSTKRVSPLSGTACSTSRGRIGPDLVTPHSLGAFCAATVSRCALKIVPAAGLAIDTMGGRGGTGRVAPFSSTAGGASAA